MKHKMLLKAYSGLFFVTNHVKINNALQKYTCGTTCVLVKPDLNVMLKKTGAASDAFL
jgi:hypothetical protein